MWVNGDKAVEPDEAIPIVITNPTNAIIQGGLGLVTILNDDPPAITINDTSGMEGNSGLTYFVFTVSLSVPTTRTVSVNFSTANGTATRTKHALSPRVILRSSWINIG